ncbi:membrane protein [Xylella fastidiosa]|uniref:membrane protein n=1 Tax=Xylella fastidiosa TaxID=2371 RepID=UPI0003D39BCF|nr:membrane protein [Xylella fastidiosa]ALR08794.2 hypothetical protein XFFB_05705 [Xylella fastidiosa]ETE32806.1 membrane protein [Xylella fastidiosa 32]QPB73327.1 hypothetical protein XFC3_05135 [Xylella fastidiosa]WGZ32915.1 hypothetical protein O4444_04785 [Xylella fastidiosa subsp. pauca]WGZ35444.1 hypothetical protein O4445_06180 [Xylella fastidiosa subsp. pauca]
MKPSTEHVLAKVPEVTLGFWLIKITATTLGETGGDAVSMSMNLGYLVGTGIFAVIFLAAVIAQIKAKGFYPVLYWTTIIATTTRLARRSPIFGIGYVGGSSLLLALLLGSLFIWHRTLGSVSVSTVSSPKAEAFYWLTRPSCSVGCSPAYYWTRVSCTLLFWAAFIMTRPIGAVVGDFLDKPLSAGGLALSRLLGIGRAANSGCYKPYWCDLGSFSRAASWRIASTGGGKRLKAMPSNF